MKSRLFLQENEDKKMVKILFVCHGNIRIYTRR